MMIPTAIGNLCNASDLLEVWIDPVNRKDIVQFTSKGIIIETIRGSSARAIVSPSQYDELKQMGFHVQLIGDKRVNRNFDGYHTYESLTTELIGIQAAHPDICRLISIGKSYLGKDLWFMKITDHPDTDEDEPEVKYIATMHGDEPVGMELTLYLIRYLTDNYGSDSRITHLINEIELWIMPLMNPDGLGQQNRMNAQGFDLNRSFPDRVSDPINTVTGRPIEVQHIMNWQFHHSPVLGANFHGGALVVNYPFDSDPDYWATYSKTPDDDVFIQMSLTYSSANLSMFNNPEFYHGITNGIAWYIVFGGMQDWNYVWMGCHEVTLEVCNEKAPNILDIPKLWNENRESMIAYMEWALKGIRGIVTDSATHTPLPATIRVVGRDHNVFTDPDVGNYHRILLPGIYTIEVSSKGYATKRIENIIVQSDTATRIDVQLDYLYYSDLNQDGKWDIADAIIILQMLTGIKIDLPAQFQFKDDSNFDGRIGMEEVINVFRNVSAYDQ